MNDQQFSDEAINDVAAALKQLLSVDPQLLFKAAGKVGSEFMLDSLKVGAQGKEKAEQTYQFRGGLCLALSRILLNSGRAHLDAQDMGAIFDYIRFQNGR